MFIDVCLYFFNFDLSAKKGVQVTRGNKQEHPKISVDIRKEKACINNVS